MVNPSYLSVVLGFCSWITVLTAFFIVKDKGKIPPLSLVIFEKYSISKTSSISFEIYV